MSISASNKLNKAAEREKEREREEQRKVERDRGRERGREMKPFGTDYPNELALSSGMLAMVLNGCEVGYLLGALRFIIACAGAVNNNKVERKRVSERERC